jgi:precorrin-8X/cobalt-precorrin-8 methylmutase
LSSPEGDRLFDRYVVVDWSARNTPTIGSDSIWIADVSERGRIVANPPTRNAAAAHLDKLVDRCRDERLLIGFDASLGYPAGTARSLGLSGSAWEATWRLIAELSEDDEHNRNNRFEVADELNRRIGQSAGPFWGCPQARVGQYLAATKPVSGDLAEYRLTERRLRSRGWRPATCWQLFGVGSVGGQTLTLLPVLEALRSERRSRVEVWPFTTGLAAPRVDPGATVVAEVWPSAFPLAEAGEQVADVKDARQVVGTAEALCGADQVGELATWMTPTVHVADAARAESEEGWVLGADLPKQV